METRFASSAAVSELLEIHNYLVWSVEVKTFLMAQDIWEIVETTDERPNPENNEAAFKTWTKKNAMALHVIQISCKPRIGFVIRLITSANIAWDTLKELCDIPQCKYEVVEEESDCAWSDRMKEILMCYGLWDIVEATTQSPTPEIACEDWSKNARALYLIRESCGSDRFSSIKEIDAAEAAWKLCLPDNVSGLESNVNDMYISFIHEGNYEAAKEVLGPDSEAVMPRSSYDGSTALHVAVSAGHVNIVKKLVKIMSNEELKIKDQDKYTALGHSAFVGNIEIAECIIAECADLLSIGNGNEHLIPVVLALAFNPKGIEMARYLYYKTPAEDLNPENGVNGATFITQAIYAKAFDLALVVLKRYPELVIALDCYDESPVQALAASSSAFASGNRLTFLKQWIYNILPQGINNSSTHATDEIPISLGEPENINGGQVRTSGSARGFVSNLLKLLARGFVSNLLKLLEIDQIYELKQVHHQSNELLLFMCEVLRGLSSELLENCGAEEAVIKAVKNGIVEFVQAMLKVCPQLFWSEEESTGRDIFMLAVLHRQNEVFDRLCTLPAKNAILAVTISLNNILHVAAMFESTARHNTVPGAAFLMQREVQWYKEVESFVPPSFLESANENGQTPRELFTESHRELVKEGEKWMKETATSCTVVNALIVTIMFAAAITVPGGNNQMTGVPMFLDKDVSPFMVFIISDALSLLSASTSLLMFIGILTSRYAEEDFLKSLPKKMIIGFFTLIISLVFMMTTFCASLFLILPGKSKMVIPVVCLAIVPVALFAWMQLPLLIDMVKSTWGFRILNKKVKTG